MSEEKKCLKCGTVLAEDQDFCPKCGSEYGTKKCLNCGAKLGEDQDFCTKCGTEYGKKKCKKCGEIFEGKKAICVKCEKKKKKNRIILLIPVVILIVFFVAVIARGLQMSGGSFDQLKKIITEGHFSCLIAHDFTEPNCQHGYLCSECGYEEGDVTDHEWLAATCTTPQTCSVCGATSGSALGHTTRFGICSRCNVKITELSPEYNLICEYYYDAVDCLSTATDYWKAARSSYYLRDTYYEYALDQVQYAAMYCDLAIDVCGNYSEFSVMKSNLQSISRLYKNAKATDSGISSAILDSDTYWDNFSAQCDKFDELMH